MKDQITKATLFAFLIICAASIGVVLQYSGQSQDIRSKAASSEPTLRSFADPKGFLIGSNTNPAPLGRWPIFDNTLASQFNFLSTANALKFSTISPAKDEYNLAEVNKIFDFAAVNRMKIKIHAALSRGNKQIPDWLESGSFTPGQVRAIAKKYLQTVGTYHKDQIYAWDVVNEPLDYNGSMKGNFWYQHLGPNYIQFAFETAHEANPNAVLILNENNAEGLSNKANALFDLVKNLKQQGVPIHGVGLQAHFTLQENSGTQFIQGSHPPYADLVANLKRYDGIGVDVYISELDVRLKLPSTEANLTKQAALYRDVLRGCLSVPACKAVTLWGFTDKISWVPEAFPGFGEALIFDGSYKPKPSYFALLSVLAGKQITATPTQIPTATPTKKPTPTNTAIPTPKSTHSSTLQPTYTPTPTVNIMHSPTDSPQPTPSMGSNDSWLQQVSNMLQNKPTTTITPTQSLSIPPPTSVQKELPFPEDMQQADIVERSVWQKIWEWIVGLLNIKKK